MNSQDVWTYLPLLVYKISQIFLASALVTRQLAGGGRRGRWASLAQTRILPHSLFLGLFLAPWDPFTVHCSGKYLSACCRPCWFRCFFWVVFVLACVFVLASPVVRRRRHACLLAPLLSCCLAGCGLAGCLFCTNTCSSFPAFLPVFQGEGEHHVHPVCA